MGIIYTEIPSGEHLIVAKTSTQYIQECKDKLIGLKRFEENLYGDISYTKDILDVIDSNVVEKGTLIDKLINILDIIEKDISHLAYYLEKVTKNKDNSLRKGGVKSIYQVHVLKEGFKLKDFIELRLVSRDKNVCELELVIKPINEELYWERVK